jgi:hypothetical protein
VADFHRLPEHPGGSPLLLSAKGDCRAQVCGNLRISKTPAIFVDLPAVFEGAWTE